MTSKKLISKEYLLEQYVNKDRSLEDIASDLGIGRETVRQRCLEYGIAIKPKYRKITNGVFGFKVGHVSWLRGKKMTKEQKSKLNVVGLSLGRTEKYNSIYKGGITSKDKLERMRFRNEVQKLVFERDNYTCQLCGGVGGKLQVDHIQSWANYVDKRFDMNNCRTLCMSCHYFITFGKPMPTDIGAWGHNLSERRIAK